jgi:hypothetical protein
LLCDIYSAGFVIATFAAHSFWSRTGIALHLCNARPRFDMGSASNGLRVGGAYLSRPEECTLIDAKPAESAGMALGTRRWPVADLGVDRDSCRKAVGIIFDFLVMEELSHKVHPLLARLAGAEALLRQAVSANADGNGGAMGAGMRMMTARLCMGQIQKVSRDLRVYTDVQVGADAVAAPAIPGLLQAV